jgi:hypothetical protein
MASIPRPELFSWNSSCSTIATNLFAKAQNGI